MPRWQETASARSFRKNHRHARSGNFHSTNMSEIPIAVNQTQRHKRKQHSAGVAANININSRCLAVRLYSNAATDVIKIGEFNRFFVKSKNVTVFSSNVDGQQTQHLTLSCMIDRPQFDVRDDTILNNISNCLR